MNTSATTQRTASKETTAEQTGSVSQLISLLKCPMPPTDFERIAQLVTAEICHWKARYESMEKKHGNIALEKASTQNELMKRKRELDLVKDQVTRAETDRRVWMERMERDANLRAARFREEQKESAERERKWKEMYEIVREDFEEAKMEKAKLGDRVVALEFEKEKAEREAEECNRRFVDLNRRISRLELDAASLMNTMSEERREVEGPVASETTDEIVNELVMDGNEGGSNGEGSGNDFVTELSLTGKRSRVN